MLFETLRRWSPILMPIGRNRSKRANLVELFGANLHALAVANGELNRMIMVVDHAGPALALEAAGPRMPVPAALPDPSCGRRVAG